MIKSEAWVACLRIRGSWSAMTLHKRLTGQAAFLGEAMHSDGSRSRSARVVSNYFGFDSQCWALFVQCEKSYWFAWQVWRRSLCQISPATSGWRLCWPWRWRGRGFPDWRLFSALTHLLSHYCISSWLIAHIRALHFISSSNTIIFWSPLPYQSADVWKVIRCHSK